MVMGKTYQGQPKETCMATVTESSLSALYTEDETAWLEAMAALIHRGELASFDLDNLAEYLSDMARRDRREVKSRLTTLLVHLLKWEFQKDKRSRSWRTTVLAQSQELSDLAGQGVLRAHAQAVLSDAYKNAVNLAAAETGLAKASFPTSCPYTVEQLLAIELPEGDLPG
jgi:hypothetical protein